jgi:hypothetical protein
LTAIDRHDIGFNEDMRMVYGEGARNGIEEESIDQITDSISTPRTPNDEKRSVREYRGGDGQRLLFGRVT